MSQAPVLLLGNRGLALGERFRVLTPTQSDLGADGPADFLAQTTDGPVHVVAESSASAPGCWLAIRYPHLVRRLVLAGPECLDDELLGRVGEIQAETLVVFDSTAPDHAGQAVQQRIPRVYRFFVYAPHKLAGLIADFLERGETFVVNTGAQAGW
jgi:pimeloyl-ACP methyl ester carboxylesterase